jgi:hypothetical protein
MNANKENDMNAKTHTAKEALLIILENGAWDSEANVERKLQVAGFTSKEIFSAVEALEAAGYLQCKAYLVRMPYGRGIDSQKRIYKRNGGGYTNVTWGTEAMPLFADGV